MHADSVALAAEERAHLTDSDCALRTVHRHVAVVQQAIKCLWRCLGCDQCDVGVTQQRSCECDGLLDSGGLAHDATVTDQCNVGVEIDWCTWSRHDNVATKCARDEPAARPEVERCCSLLILHVLRVCVQERAVGCQCRFHAAILSWPGFSLRMVDQRWRPSVSGTDTPNSAGTISGSGALRPSSRFLTLFTMIGASAYWRMMERTRGPSAGRLRAMLASWMLSTIRASRGQRGSLWHL